MTGAPNGVRVRLMTPCASPGAAIAIIQIEAPNETALDESLAQMSLGVSVVGDVALGELPGGDRGLVVRWSPTCAQLFPHGGRLVLDEMRIVLEHRGLELVSEPGEDPRTTYPEARDLIEACALDAIAKAAAARAIDVILDQARRWRDGAACEPPSEKHDAMLNRLFEPPIIALAGPPNAGKSTMVNALARRDHVGVMLEVDGLVVRCLDLPGFAPDSADPIERHSIDLAAQALAGADLILLCQSPDTTPIDLPDDHVARALRVGTKADLGFPEGEVVVAVSAQTGAGLPELAQLIRGTLIPDETLQSPRLWRFHPQLPSYKHPGA